MYLFEFLEYIVYIDTIIILNNVNKILHCRTHIINIICDEGAR